MHSKSLSNRRIGAEPGFQWRGDEITRIEGLSDAVFAFAVTLLIVSLEAPKSFDDLYQVVRGLPTFAMTFFLLMLIWYTQYKFFRRYGLQDAKTVVLTIVLLFVILFYVYPLKFLFSGLFAPLVEYLVPSKGKAPVNILTDAAGMSNLMILYHAGVMAVYIVFTWMYLHAYAMRDALGLNAVEVHDTKASVSETMFLASLGTAGLVMSVFGNNDLVSISGIMYGPACGIYFSISGAIFERKRKKLLAQLGVSL